MYEMYPDAWTDDRAVREQRDASDQPRRRARKEHSVISVELAERSSSAADRTNA